MSVNHNEVRVLIEGGKPLKGQVKTSGAKNAALPILAACILLDGHYEISNVPPLSDIQIMIRMLKSLNVRAEYHDPETVKIWNTKHIRPIAPYDLVTSMRASFFVAGPILAKTGYAKVPLPGGCAIGSRPLDLHLKGFKALGADVNIQHGFVELKVNKLTGNRIYLDFPSVGATENIMMAACLAEGVTLLENAAKEPEIEDLGNFLNASGADIQGLGTSTLTITGKTSLKGSDYSVIPDRIEAGTMMIAAAITNGDVLVENVVPDHLEPVIRKLKEAGCLLDVQPTTIRVSASDRLQSVDIDTMPFPGFPTDMPAQMMSLLTLAEGSGVVKESIFENRFMHAHELMRMGADIKIDNNTAIVTGVPQLTGAEVKITDLRAGAALILAGLAARGKTQIYGLHHLRRGYYNLAEKLRQLGGHIIE